MKIFYPAAMAIWPSLPEMFRNFIFQHLVEQCAVVVGVVIRCDMTASWFLGVLHRGHEGALDSVIGRAVTAIAIVEGRQS